RHLRPTLFPYTTLFRSQAALAVDGIVAGAAEDHIIAAAGAEADGVVGVDGCFIADEHVVVGIAVKLIVAAIAFDNVIAVAAEQLDRKSTRLNSSHLGIS